jgi:diguanylate cyclase (GGDEF)-like protein
MDVCEARIMPRRLNATSSSSDSGSDRSSATGDSAWSPIEPLDAPSPFNEPSFLSGVLHTLDASVCVLDLAGQLVWVTRAWRQFAQQNGHADADRLLGCNYLAVCDNAIGPGAEDAVAAAAGIRNVMRGHHGFYLDYPCHSKLGHRWFQLRVGRFDHGEQTWIVVSHENISERKRAELRYHHLAEHDQLTGLANRLVLMRKLRQSIDSHRRFALLLVDIDRFRHINDTLGHDVGDALLRSTGQRLLTRFAEGALAARMGGDEIVVLLLHDEEEVDVLMAAASLRSDLARPHLAAGYSLQPTLSIGIVFSHDAVYLRTTDVLKDADVALDEAKLRGGDCAVRFHLDLRSRAMQRLHAGKSLPTDRGAPQRPRESR